MPQVQVKEGIFYTAHRSVSQKIKGIPTGYAHHEVKFGGVSTLNIKTHVAIPGVLKTPLLQNI